MVRVFSGSIQWCNQVCVTGFFHKPRYNLPIQEVLMSSHKIQAMKSLEVALDHALARLNQLEGKDRLAFANEYKEWLADDDLKEKVWFSIPVKNASDMHED